MSALSPRKSPDVSVVIPCLNEAQSIAAVVKQAFRGLDAAGRTGEVIVVDNGSTDGSGAIALEHGARVVDQPVRGYGNAYLAGLAAADGAVIVIGDADETYDFGDIPRFVAGIEGGAELVMGNRLVGKLSRESMPWSHRWIGNPMITTMVRVMLHADVSDAYCGMRAFRRDLVPQLDLRSPGMEFALEMVYKAAQRGVRITEVPIDYHPRRGESKLNTVSDGWRSVKFILQHSPSFLFFAPAVVLAVPGLLGTIALSAGPVEVFGRVWQINALLLSVLLLILGTQVAQFGVIARTFGSAQLNTPDRLLEGIYRRVRLEHVLAGAAAAVVAGILLLAAVGAVWGGGGFGALRHEHQSVIGLMLIGLGLQTMFAAFLVSIVGRPIALRSAEVSGAHEPVPTSPAP